MRTFWKAAVVAAAAWTMAVATPASATVYSLAGDWSNTNNANGVWTYRAGTATLPSVADWYGVGPAWAPGVAGGHFLPVIFQATANGNPGLDWKIGDIVTHTTDEANGGGMGLSNILFTAPTAGIADLTGYLWNARITAGRPQAYGVYVNGTLVDGGALVGHDRDHGLNLSLSNIALAAGQTIDLVLYKTGAAGGTGDFVGMRLDIDFMASAVPEPSTWALMLTGFVGIGFMMRRRFNRPRTA